MQKGAGHANNTRSDADETTDRSGKCGTGHARGTTSIKHSRMRWTPASREGCEECSQPLEEWEVDICEGCGIEKSNG
jgi:hypothetical protein